MLHDRVLVEVDRDAGERRSTGGIVIPATAAMGARRLAWSRVVAVGPHARSVEVGDRVLFDPEDKSEVEVHGETYVVMRERDVHARAIYRQFLDIAALPQRVAPLLQKFRVELLASEPRPGIARHHLRQERRRQVPRIVDGPRLGRDGPRVGKNPHKER